MGKKADWTVIRNLGSGGQSEVFLVRSPKRQAERREALQEIAAIVARSGTGIVAEELGESLVVAAREDRPEELGAMKVFTLRNEGTAEQDQALKRLALEEKLLRKGIPGTLVLLDANLDERWIVTKYHPRGSLDKNIKLFAGSPLRALRAFRPLVAAVSEIHKDGNVHRDIKPANVFVSEDDGLVLGDFGIVFQPDLDPRVTVTDEKVGPRDYMPPWADTGERLSKVKPCFDVYMLAKLLWCMVAGRRRLPREWFLKGDYNLTKLYPDDPNMFLINSALNSCIVEEPEQCLESAGDLLTRIDKILLQMTRGGYEPAIERPKPCRICGVGYYRSDCIPTEKKPPHVTGLQFNLMVNQVPQDTLVMAAWLLICDYCGHMELFSQNPPGPWRY